jgi:hypothetical protein
MPPCIQPASRASASIPADAPTLRSRPFQHIARTRLLSTSDRPASHDSLFTSLPPGVELSICTRGRAYGDEQGAAPQRDKRALLGPVPIGHTCRTCRGGPRSPSRPAGATAHNGPRGLNTGAAATSDRPHSHRRLTRFSTRVRLSPERSSARQNATIADVVDLPNSLSGSYFDPSRCRTIVSRDPV